MPSRERIVDRGTRRATGLIAELGREVRQARVEHGLSQTFVGRAVGLSGPAVSRIERGQVRAVSMLNLARLLSVVGLDLSARAYPSGPPIRDQAQITLLQRLRNEVSEPLTWRAEVPVGGPGDLRAWDVVISSESERMAVEAETRLADLQAVQRRIALKCRDSGIARVVLLMSASRANRSTLRLFEDPLRESFPVRGSEALRALRNGRLPAGSAVILL